MARKTTEAAETVEKTETTEAAETVESVALVAMTRGEQTADVHPSEVENFKLGGWQVAE